MLQLEDKSRVVPARVPRDASGFAAWQSFACVEWPPELMIEAFLAWEAMHLRNENATEMFKGFLRSYENWLELPEGSKLHQMMECQADSTSRIYYLSRARLNAAVPVTNGDYQ